MMTSVWELWPSLYIQTLLAFWCNSLDKRGSHVCIVRPRCWARAEVMTMWVKPVSKWLSLNVFSPLICLSHFTLQLPIVLKFLFLLLLRISGLNTDFPSNSGMSLFLTSISVPSLVFSLVLSTTHPTPIFSISQHVFLSSLPHHHRLMMPYSRYLVEWVTQVEVLQGVCAPESLHHWGRGAPEVPLRVAQQGTAHLAAHLNVAAHLSFRDGVASHPAHAFKLEKRKSYFLFFIFFMYPQFV